MFDTDLSMTPAPHFAIAPLGVLCQNGYSAVAYVLDNALVAGVRVHYCIVFQEDSKQEFSMHLSGCRKLVHLKKAVIVDFQLCRFAYGCVEGVRKRKMCVHRGEQCKMCVLSAGVSVAGLAAPVCSSQGDL